MQFSSIALRPARAVAVTSRPSLLTAGREKVGLLFVVLFMLAVGAYSRAARAQASPAPQALLEQLNQVSIDPLQVYVLRDAQITRDRIKIYFNRGFVGFFTKTGGEITGAAFTGDGEVLLIPPDPVEKRNLAQFIQSPILEERFTTAYLRFTDQTAKQLLAMARKPDPEDLERPTGFLEEWNPVVHRLSPDYSMRILEDLLDDRSRPYFHAQIQGANLGVFEVTEDERLLEAVVMGAARRRQGRPYADIWSSFPSRSSQARAPSLMEGAVRVLSYKIDTRITDDHSLEGRAELGLETRSGPERVLPFELSRRLKVSEVKDERGQRLVVFQNPAVEESELAARGNDAIIVVLPSFHPVGEKFRLNFTYQGNVITDVGNGVFYVGARGSWYPNRGLSDRATYDLTFHYPDRLTLVATGSRVEETSSQGWKHSRWVSDGPFPVVGFNLGVYESRLRRAGNSLIEVYAAREAEALLEQRHAAKPADQQDLRMKLVPVAPPLSPSALLDNVAESAARALEYFEALFGPLPYPRLAVSQISGEFGQGWPELVYLPTLSFLSGPERTGLVQSAKQNEVTDQTLLAHEIAHQWWGNLLGWKTYRDQWLSEGVASYAAALYLAQQDDGEQRFRRMLRGYKQDLLSKTREGKTVEAGGPIWLGERLSNSLDPDGYENIVYKKSCWVLHMLRRLMTDPTTGSDERFFRMLRNFVTAYRGGNPSTEDFVRHAEKYMTPASDLAHNRRLDWFFRDWVYGTGIPTYKLQATTERRASNQFAVEGSIEQSGVSEEFEMLAPVIAYYGKDQKPTLLQVVVTDAGGKFRFATSSKPSRVSIDEDNILAVVP